MEYPQPQQNPQEQSKKYWFFGSKLNTALLLVLIVLMVIALRWMYQDKERYFPILSSHSIEKVTADSFIIKGIITDVKSGCQVDAGDCAIIIDNKYSVATSCGTRLFPCDLEGRGSSEDLNTEDSVIGKKIEAFVLQKRVNYFTLYGNNNFYVKFLK